jgi:hypothetical protein
MLLPFRNPTHAPRKEGGKVVEIPREPLLPIEEDSDDDGDDRANQNEDPPPAPVFHAHEMEIFVSSKNTTPDEKSAHGHPSYPDLRMSVSADGTRLVVVAGFPYGSGTVQTFGCDGLAAKWIRLGPENIWGKEHPPNDGRRENNNNNIIPSYDDVRVAMSPDGNRIAISGLLSAKRDADHKDVPVAGVIDVLGWKGGEWQRLGDSIEEPMRCSHFLGYISVALSGDGSRIVVGASSDVHRSDCSSFLTRNGEGRARVLDWNGSQWEIIWEFLPTK